MLYFTKATKNGSKRLIIMEDNKVTLVGSNTTFTSKDFFEVNMLCEEIVYGNVDSCIEYLLGEYKEYERFLKDEPDTFNILGSIKQEIDFLSNQKFKL